MNVARNSRLRDTGLGAVLVPFALVMSLSACLAPVPDYGPVDETSEAASEFGCVALVPDDVLETAGTQAMQIVHPRSEIELGYPGIPTSVAVAGLGGTTCIWEGPKEPLNATNILANPSAQLVIAVVPDVAEAWRASAEPYGPAIEDHSCSTIIADAAMCGTLRLLPDGVLVGIRFSGLALDRMEGDDTDDVRDAASVSYAAIADAIIARVSAAPPRARTAASPPLANAPEADCADFLPDAAVASLAGSDAASSEREGWSPTVESTALLVSGGGSCSWSTENEYDDPSDPEAHVLESLSFGLVHWQSNAADSMPSTDESRAVDLAGLTAPDGAWMRAKALVPVIDIRIGEHWVSVTLTNKALPETTLDRFAQAVVDALLD